MYEVRFGLIRLIHVDRDVHKCAQPQIVCEKISLINPSVGRVVFILAWTAVLVEVIERTAVLFDVGVNRS